MAVGEEQVWKWMDCEQEGLAEEKELYSAQVFAEEEEVWMQQGEGAMGQTDEWAAVAAVQWHVAWEISEARLLLRFRLAEYA